MNKNVFAFLFGFLIFAGITDNRAYAAGEESYQKGLEIFNGINPDADKYKNAFSYFVQAAKEGNADAYFMLALYSDMGIAVRKNPGLAFMRYQKSADLGNAYAMFSIADMYMNGEGVARPEPTRKKGCVATARNEEILFFSRSRDAVMPVGQTDKRRTAPASTGRGGWLRHPVMRSSPAQSRWCRWPNRPRRRGRGRFRSQEIVSRPSSVADFAGLESEGQRNGALTGGGEGDGCAFLGRLVEGEHDFEDVVGQLAVDAVLAVVAEGDGHVGRADGA